MQQSRYLADEQATVFKDTVDSLYLELARDQRICSFEIERVRDRKRKMGKILHKETKTLVRDREKFEIEGARDRESQLYIHIDQR